MHVKHLILITSISHLTDPFLCTFQSLKFICFSLQKCVYLPFRTTVVNWQFILYTDNQLYLNILLKVDGSHQRLHCQTSCIRCSTLEQTSCHCIHVIMPVMLQSNNIIMSCLGWTMWFHFKCRVSSRTTMYMRVNVVLVLNFVCNFFYEVFEEVGPHC